MSVLDYHELPDGRRFPRVTAILSALGSPDLATRAARAERALVVQHASALHAESPALSAVSFPVVLADRLPKLSAMESFRDARAEVGTQVHDAIATELRGEPGTPVDLEAAQILGNWRAWAAEVRLEPHLIEHRVINEDGNYAGTIDLGGYVTIRGRRLRVVIDWKSGAHAHRARLQLAAYSKALARMGLTGPDTYGLVVRLPRNPGDRIDTWLMEPSEVARHYAVFESLYRVWIWQRLMDTGPEPAPKPSVAPRPITATSAFSFATK